MERNLIILLRRFIANAERANQNWNVVRDSKDFLKRNNVLKGEILREAKLESELSTLHAKKYHSRQMSRRHHLQKARR